MRRVGTCSLSQEELDCLKSMSEVDEAIADADKQISRLISRRALLQSHRNTLASISRFPAEIVSRIFRFCVSQCADDSSAPGQSQLLILTHVCQYWRSVVLHDPSFWTHADFTHPQIGYMTICRAQELPLSLTFPISKEGHEEQLQDIESILARKERIRALDITASHEYLQKYFYKIISGPAPLLERLCLSNPDEDEYITPDNLPTSAPRLRVLILHGWKLSPKIGVLSHLSYLSMRMAATGLPLTSVLSILRDLPLLDEFDLEQSNVDKREAGSILSHWSHQDPVELPLLTRLILVDTTHNDAPPIGKFLKLLSTPRLARIHIHAEGQGVNSLQLIGDWLRDWVNMSSRRSLSSLSLHLQQAKFEMRLRQSRGLLHSSEDDDYEFTLKLNFAWSAAVEQFFSSMVRCEVLPASLMTELSVLELTAMGLDTIEPGWADNNINWKDFATLPLVEISMDDTSCWSFLRYAGTSGPSRSGWFSALRAVTLKNVIMWQGMEGRSDRDNDPSHTMTSMLAAWTRRRKSLGMPIERLVLKSCYCLSDPCPEFQDSVAHFIMDPPF